jgi:flagellar basal body rod protein FlgG
MDNALLVSLSQQLAAYRSMDVIANNLANLSTPAFKRETVKFEELVQQLRPSEDQSGPQTLSFVQDTGVVRDTISLSTAMAISWCRPQPENVTRATAISRSTATDS